MVAYVYFIFKDCCLVVRMLYYILSNKFKLQEFIISILNILVPLRGCHHYIVRKKNNCLVVLKSIPKLFIVHM